MATNKTSMTTHANLWAGNLLLPLRLVLGWTYFSAFWRRLVLENKLDPDAAGYIGEKFNHFLPNALLIKPMIEYFVSNPEILWWKLLAFTLIEGVVGLALMFGFMTRIAGLAVSGLALGILLGAGWLGTTCLDEWQIGILGVAAGLSFFFAGGGRYSIDYSLRNRKMKPLMAFAFTTDNSIFERFGKVTAIAGVAALALTLGTNQYFHGGVWGKLHNKSVKPKFEITSVQFEDRAVSADFMRVEGPDVYGSFAVEFRVLDASGKLVLSWDAAKLAAMSAGDITNEYVAKVKPGARSLIFPLGAKARVTFRDAALDTLPVGSYEVELVDVSGKSWRAPFEVES